MRSRPAVAAALSGVIASAVDVGALALLVECARAPVPAAAGGGAVAGAVVGFALGKCIAFRDRSSITLGQLARFGAVAAATALLTSLAMRIVAIELGVPYLAAKALCAAAVFLAWTYPAQRRLVFPAPRARPGGGATRPPPPRPSIPPPSSTSPLFVG
jgi:putative flippase GtrA